MKRVVIMLFLVLASGLAWGGWAESSPEVRAEVMFEARAINPLGEVERARWDGGGEITDRVNAGSYVYLEVRMPGADETVWLVVMDEAAPEDVGDRVRFRAFGHQRDFHSRRTGRSFDLLYFGALLR